MLLRIDHFPKDKIGTEASDDSSPLSNSVWGSGATDSIFTVNPKLGQPATEFRYYGVASNQSDRRSPTSGSRYIRMQRYVLVNISS
jgi:hypothetical protein